MMGFRKAGEAVDIQTDGRVVGGGATIVEAGESRDIQGRAPRSGGWTKMRQAQFLRVLGTTCNVRTAAADVGMAVRTAYALRLRDPGFAAAWAAALADGYDRLEEALLAAAIAGLSGDLRGEAGDAGNTAGEIEGISVSDTGVVRLTNVQAVQVALAMLGRFRSAQAEGGKREKLRHRRATVEETNASIAKKLDALAKRRVAASAVAVIGRGSVSGNDDGVGGAGAVLGNGVRHAR